MTIINGLPLPAALVLAIEDGSWVAPSDANLLERVFSDRPEYPSFYTLEYMRIENKFWPRTAGMNPQLLGKLDSSMPPGDIEPTMSLLIGDLGYDMPFALDFRTSMEAPRVVYAHPATRRWTIIAPRIEELLAVLQSSDGGAA